ncbi:superoxide dismutase family protein [Streptomyces sp. TRM70308]|uniref:superoxide dismutase family protein n=1 Tax=Streptomyces sp. TRM70308 TaxID=3131932 RepID=UPI003CFDA205
MMTGPATAALATALAVLPAAVAHGGTAADGAAGEAAPGQAFTAAAFAPVRDGRVPTAVTYAPELVPPGARVAVHQRVGAAGTTVALHVSGVAPHRTYGAHVHTRPCGPDPAEAGPHYQNAVAPDRPSADPAYVNPRNEVWLDLTTDASGTGRSVARQAWTFRPGGARSVVLHEHATQREGDPGQAGARLACVTADFLPR